MVDESKDNVDEQNFDVDIDKVYQNFIVEIDKIRSHFSVQNNTIDLKSANSLGSNINVDREAQESRCHAFYRLMGLPVVSSDGKTLYCPGYDKPNNANNVLNNGKLQTAQNISKELFKLMDVRENVPRDFLAIFAQQGIDASALALSSVQTRPFVSSLEKEGPFDIQSKNQSHTLSGGLGTLIKDSSGNPPTKLSSSRLHVLKPFMVDPRIDLSVTPNRYRLCVPFLKDKNETKLTDNVFLKRPFIEKVCRERFSISAKSLVIGDHTNAVIENIKNDKSIKDQQLIKAIFETKLVTSEKIQFANYINIIRSMLKKLSDSVDNVLPVIACSPTLFNQAKYNWIPIPNVRGPEYGCITRDVIQQGKDPFNTDADKELIYFLYRQEVITINNKLRAKSKSDLGGFAFDDNEITPDANSSDAWGNKTLVAIDELKTKRKSITDQANSSLREIEIIMGEFSGLGLCDILAISAALWIVDKETLINMLDQTAIDRMLTLPDLSASEVQAASASHLEPTAVLTKFESKVKEIFQLMDAIYKDIRTKNSR